MSNNCKQCLVLNDTKSNYIREQNLITERTSHEKRIQIILIPERSAGCVVIKASILLTGDISSLIYECSGKAIENKIESTFLKLSTYLLIVAIYTSEC